MKRILALILTLAVLMTAWILPAQAEMAYASATVKGGWLRLRVAASDQAEVVASYYTGTVVTVVGQSGDWYYVIAPDGNTGFMHRNYLNVRGSITGGSGSGSSGTTSATAYIWASNGKPVRVRTGPSQSYAVLASYEVGTRVTILIEGEDWCKIQVGTRTGYIMTEFLVKDGENAPGTTTPSTYTAYVTAANGKPVRLRSGPGESYSILTSYDVGTQMTVLEYGATWCYVRSSAGTTGYMMTKFLTTTRPSVLTGVQVNTSSARVGDRLTARVTPSNAQVTYEWLNDQGYRVGTGSTYTVRTSDSGRRIRVRVTGSGSTTGTAVSGWVSVSGSGSGTTGYTLTGITLSSSAPVVGQSLTATLIPSGAAANIYWYLDNGSYMGYGRTFTVPQSAVGHRVFAYAEGTGSTNGTATSAYTQLVTGSVSQQILLNSVSLSDTTPAVGQTLSAILSPSNATASILWYRDDGTYLGSGSDYTVKATDAGHMLYVWAQGSGNTTGSATSSYSQKVTSSASTSYRIESVSLNDTTPTVGQTLYVTITPSGATANLLWYRDDNTYLGSGASYTVKAADAGHMLYVWAQGTGNTTGSATSAYTQAVTAAGSGSTQNRINTVEISKKDPKVGEKLQAIIDPANATAEIMWLWGSWDEDVIVGYGPTYVVQQTDLGHTLYLYVEGTGSTFGAATSQETDPVGYPQADW